MSVVVSDLTWGDEVIPVKVSFYALMEMQDETGVTVTTLAGQDGFNLKAMEALFFYSMISGCRHRKIEPMFERKESPFIWEDVCNEFSTVATEALTRSDNGKKKEKKRITPSVN